MIQRLTADLAEAQATVTKLQDALDRRVRQSRVSLARHRAESELLMGELKEKLAIKTAECDRLKSARYASLHNFFLSYTLASFVLIFLSVTS